MMLIEVVISALLVALISIGTLTGLIITNKATGVERARAQATTLAQQNEEQLRGELATTLESESAETPQTVSENGLCVEQASSVWKFCKSTAKAGERYVGTVFTITSSKALYAANEESATCEIENTEVIKTTTTVTWPGKGNDVTQSSLVKLSKSSKYPLLVKVFNRSKAPVLGATVRVTSASGATLAEKTTPSSGCVVFGDLAATVDVVAEKENWVNYNGKSPPPAEEKALNETKITTAELPLEAPGTIVAEFESNGTPVESSVNSFTFEALNTEGGMSAPEDLVGPEGATTVLTSRSSLEVTHAFPFKASKYRVFAGTCESNNPQSVASEKVKDAEAQVEPNSSTTVKLEAPEVNVMLYEGTSSKKGSPLASSYSAKIINNACVGKNSQNYSATPNEYAVEIVNGALVQKYLPYAAKLELCVVGDIGGKYYKRTFTELTNTKKSGSSFTLYLKEKVEEEKSSPITC